MPCDEVQHGGVSGRITQPSPCRPHTPAGPPRPRPPPQVKPLGSRTLVHITATEAFFPRRTLLAPPTYLLPARVEFASDIQACVLGDLQSGKVRALTSRRWAGAA